MKFPPRVSLGYYPTPIEKLERLSAQLGGPTIWVKRDDQTGLATGGNKTRKLEFLMADAVAQGCDQVVTLGGPQSNHVRQTAAAAAKLGLKCSLVLRGAAPAQRLGNLLLDELLGAQVHWSGTRTREAVAGELMAALRSGGARPYLIPVGGSNALGSLGYVVAMQEAVAQLSDGGIPCDAMVFASSSGGTHAGMAVGAAVTKFAGRVLGIAIDAPLAEANEHVGALAREVAQRFAPEVAAAVAVETNADYLGGGYAVVGDRERDAIRTVARLEGLLLDPVYTGRAMGGLLDLIRRGEFKRGQNVLFWHTGGAAALSAFADKL